MNFAKVEIIAEIGQNHQGDVLTATKMIEVFSSLGATTVKFQLRDNKTLFHESRYNLLYDSVNAFGDTYGEHREFLELSFEDLMILRKCAFENKVKFCCTPFDLPSLDRLVRLEPDIIKCASFDLANIPFLRKVSSTKIPVVISTGGGLIDDVDASVSALDVGQPLGVLHCVSEYPCPPEKVDLLMIKVLIDRFPNCTIGISDHYNGTLTGPLAYMLGAQIFEKHVTFDRSQKGSDHKFSLEPEGFRKFVRDIERCEKMMISNNRLLRGNESVFTRLGKSCVATRELSSGHIIKIDDITGVIFNKQHIPIRESRHLVGRQIIQSIGAGEPFELSNLL